AVGSVSFCVDAPPLAISTLSLHDALPIWTARIVLRALEVVGDGLLPAEERLADRGDRLQPLDVRHAVPPRHDEADGEAVLRRQRSEEHTSELQSQSNLVCRLLLEKKNTHT